MSASTDQNSKISLLHHIRDNNSDEIAKKAIKLLFQVVNNIVKYPGEEKYRKLKEDKISPKIDNAKGFFDIIFILGFVNLDTHIELPMTANLEPLANLVGEIEGKPAPQVPKMNLTKNEKGGDCCSSSSSSTKNCEKKSGGCCGGNDSEKKKGEGCCGGKKSGGSGSTDTHDHSTHNHSHNHNHNHNHNHSHNHKNQDNGSCCTSDNNSNNSSAQKILHQNMAEIDKQKAEKKAEKEKIKQKMASSRKEKNDEIAHSSVAKNTKFGATIGTLPKETPKGNGNGGGGCC